jgi:aspartyl-tRNA synthetase
VSKIFKDAVNHEFPPFERMTWHTAMKEYGIDKPDLRFGMKLVEITELAHGKGLKMFDDSELVVAINCSGQAAMSTKKVKELEKTVKSSLIGAQGMVWVKCNSLKAGNLDFTSSVSKNFTNEQLLGWAEKCDATEGDLLLVLFGRTNKTRDSMGRLRNEMGTRLGLRDKGFYGLWVRTLLPLTHARCSGHA